jgi:endonuclease YncB( thermonuclease family)
MQKSSFIPGAVSLLLASLLLVRAGEWEELRGCRLLPNEENDGDSFHVEHDGQERIFRLYFVDAPETEGGGRLAERVAEQAETFGISEEESLQIGLRAAAFTGAALSRPFTVITRGQDAMGASQIPREYAFVKTADGDDLGEMLLSRGLARSFGKDAAFPPYKARELREKYDQLEAEARREKLGAWGDGASVPTMALPASRNRGEVEAQSFGGIGAVLSGEDGYAEVEELIPGGPAEQTGELSVNDRIVGVAQGDGPFEDVVDMTLDQVVKRIRGGRGSTVRLRVLASGSPNASRPKVISIVRDEVPVEAQQGAEEKDHLNSLLHLPERVEILPTPQPGEVESYGAGKPVSFGHKSEVLYQKSKDGNAGIDLRATVETLAKLINYKTGRLEAIVWVVPRHDTDVGYRSTLRVPGGLYKIVYAQGVRETAEGKFYAEYYGKLADPITVSLLDPARVTLSIHDTNYANVKSSAKEFGSFRPPR